MLIEFRHPGLLLGVYLENVIVMLLGSFCASTLPCTPAEKLLQSEFATGEKMMAIMKRTSEQGYTDMETFLTDFTR